MGDKSIFDYITAKAQALYWNNYLAEQSEAPYLGEELFPDVKRNTLEMKYIKGASGIAKVAPLSAFDVKVLRANRIGFQEVKTNMPFFKLALGIDETLRQELLIAEAAGEQYYMEVIRRIFDDNMQLLKSMAVTRERMRMQLLTTGAVVMATNGQAYKYDYELGTDQKVTASKSWADPEADIIGDIIKWQDTIEANTGVRPTRMVMRRSMFRNLLSNEYIKNTMYAFSPVVDGKINITEQSVKMFLENQAKISSIAIYDKIYKDENNATQHFIPDDVVILLPEGNIGQTVFRSYTRRSGFKGFKSC